MDLKNTIMKCKAHPDCLFNHNGVCDNYVINISVDGECESYVETATEEDMKNGVVGEFKGYNITKPDKPIELKMPYEEFNKKFKDLCTFTFTGQFIPEYLERLKTEAEYDCPEYDLINKKCRLPKCRWS